MIRCPCCNGFGMIEERGPVDMSPLEFRIFDVIRTSKHGIEGRALVERVYEHDPNGGPLNGLGSCRTTIFRMNKKLARVSQKIKADAPGVGGYYRLVQI